MEKDSLKGKRITRVLALLAAFACLIACVVSVSADGLEMNGSTSSGGAGGSVIATGGYSIGGGFVGSNVGRVAGYRFSIVDANGVERSTPIDIIRDSTCSAEGVCYGGTGFHRFADKMAKTELKATYASSSLSTTTSTTNVIHDTDLGLTLPEYTTGMETWNTDTNITAILTKFGYTTETLKTNRLCVLVEPLYPLTIENTKCVFTPTEIAVYGACMFGVDTTIVSSATQGTWGFIASYTNLYWPNSMRIDETMLGLEGVAESSDYLSFRSIIEKGYGAIILWGEENITAPPEYSLTVNYYSNYATGGASTSGTQKLVKTVTYDANTAYSNGLLNYSASGGGLYMTRTGYTATGKWGTSASGGTLVDEDTGFTTGAALAKAL